MSFSPNIAITIGDPNGIGPEVIIRSLCSIDLSSSTPIIISPHSLIKGLVDTSPLDEIHSLDVHYIHEISQIKNNEINVFQSTPDWNNVSFDLGNEAIPSSIGGKISMKSVLDGIHLCLNHTCHALVTAPISKESIAMAGYSVPGHTEYLMEITKSKDVVMMLSGKGLNICLLTTHIPLAKVAESITQSVIQSKINIIVQHFTTYEQTHYPRIALLGLNPHAGDGGVLGMEEEQIYTPIRSQLSQQNIRVEGPFPADSFFGRRHFQEFDVVLASYHDQGLAPFKLWSMDEGVNITLGLPIIRTSPDHGTAFNIARSWKASASSMRAAYEKAVQMIIASS